MRPVYTVATCDARQQGNYAQHKYCIYRVAYRRKPKSLTKGIHEFGNHFHFDKNSL